MTMYIHVLCAVNPSQPQSAEATARQAALQAPPSTYTDKQYDLLTLVDKTSIECLNEHSIHNIQALLFPKQKKGAMLKRCVGRVSHIAEYVPVMLMHNCSYLYHFNNM